MQLKESESKLDNKTCIRTQKTIECNCSWPNNIECSERITTCMYRITNNKIFMEENEKKVKTKIYYDIREIIPALFSL